MNRYRKGRDWEYEVKRRLQCHGWAVFRCAGSKPFDLIAFAEDELPLFIECRVGRRPSRKYILEYKLLAAAFRARYLVCVKKSNRKRRRVNAY